MSFRLMKKMIYYLHSISRINTAGKMLANKLQFFEKALLILNFGSIAYIGMNENYGLFWSSDSFRFVNATVVLASFVLDCQLDCFSNC